MNSPVAANPSVLLPSFYDPATNALLVTPEKLQQVQAGIAAKLADLPPVAAASFLNQVANLAPNSATTPAQLEDILGKFSAAGVKASNNFEAMPFVGDVAKFLARAMVEFAGQQRQQAMDDRVMARQAAQAELMSQATQMTEAAAKMMAGAIVNAVLGAVSAGITLGSSLSALKSQGSSIADMKTAMKDTKDAGQMSSQALGMKDTTSQASKMKEAENALTAANQKFGIAEKQGMQAMTQSQVAGAVADMFKTAGGAIDGTLQANAKLDDAEAARDGAQSQEFAQMADMKKETQDALKELMGQIINFVKEMQENEIDAMRSLTKI